MKIHRLMPLVVAAIGTTCTGARTDRVEDYVYNTFPELVADPTITAHELVVAEDGPLLVLHLREKGKPHFAKNLFPRAYGLEPLDSTASYQFKVRVEHVTMGGGTRVEAYEIKEISKNGRKIYPCSTSRWIAALQRCQPKNVR